MKKKYCEYGPRAGILQISYDYLKIDQWLDYKKPNQNVVIT